MTTVTVTPAQAQALAQRIEAAQQAQARAQDVLDLLTAGHEAVVGATLADVNTVTGVLTFHAPAPNAGPSADAAP